MSHDIVETKEEKHEHHAHKHVTRTLNGHETREQREQMKNLSLEVFGKSSRYKKLFEYNHVLTHKVKEVVPGENGAPDTEKEVEVPLYAKGTTKVKQSVRKYRSVEEVIELLMNFQAQRMAFMAQMKQQQEEARAKKAADDQLKKLQEELNGSALT